MKEKSNIAIEFKEVSYQIKQKNIISNLNLTIFHKEILVILGRSGSGKTTLLKLINSLLQPTQGKIIVQGKSTDNWNPIQLRRHIGYVIQEIGLFPHFNIAENVGLVPSLQGWQSSQIKERVCQLLSLVGLPPDLFAHRYPQQLSGGQKQRVGVARALAANPPILLMDEPFGALDPITRLDLQHQLLQLHSSLDKTIVFITHDIQEAFRLGTRIALMESGKLVTLGTPTEFRQSSHPEAQSFLACLRGYL
jgi:osmoprotectant transport system ATP-binding protein